MQSSLDRLGAMRVILARTYRCEMLSVGVSVWISLSADAGRGNRLIWSAARPRLSELGGAAGGATAAAEGDGGRALAVWGRRGASSARKWASQRTQLRTSVSRVSINVHAAAIVRVGEGRGQCVGGVTGCQRCKATQSMPDRATDRPTDSSFNTWLFKFKEKPPIQPSIFPTFYKESRVDD